MLKIGIFFWIFWIILIVLGIFLGFLGLFVNMILLGFNFKIFLVVVL